jgi:hypothetical protein
MMSNKYSFSIKSVAIDKTQTQMVTVVAIAAVLTVFALMFAKTLLSEQSFQSRLIHADETASSQLTADTKAANQLTNYYNYFESHTTNILGGSSTGNGPQDGSNATIILDALPSQYDFPALASSITKIFNYLNLPNNSVSGSDLEATQGNVKASNNPQPIAMPFNFSVSGTSYTSIQDLVKTLEYSIRPIQIESMSISGSQNSMTISVQAQTYYQPGKIMGITNETVN